MPGLQGDEYKLEVRILKYKRMKNKQANVIPENYIEFLHWLKEKTEASWCEKAKEGEEPHWIQDAKWIGMTDDEIDGVEKKYAVRFVPEHRQFLKILHTVDRKERIEYTESFDEDAEVKIEYRPFYYNWLSDDEDIKRMLNWPYLEILRDVLELDGVWLASWGEKVESEEEKTVIFTEWFRKTPTLLPLTSHRFLVSDETLVDRPVLSVWGSDTIVYAWSLKHFLLNEFSGALDLMNDLYDNEGNLRDMEYGDELGELNEKEYELSKSKTIPIFNEMILYWSSGWGSFGMEYPYPDSGGGQLIVKAGTDFGRSFEDCNNEE